MEIDDYLWETLYIMKALHDHGTGGELLAAYKDETMDADDYCNLAMDAIGHIFERTFLYYNEEKELEVWVFFDPIFQEFYSLCAQYERERHVMPENNPFRQDMEKSLEYDLYFNSYDYGYHIYDDAGKKCRIVLMLGCEFQGYYEIVPGLLDIDEACRIQTQKLREELGLIPRREDATPAAEERKEAA